MQPLLLQKCLLLQLHRHPEFWHMQEPKITKLKGGYSADAELVFWSWRVDVLVHIQDCELDNQAMIQLIKDQTQDSACGEVKFQYEPLWQ